MVNTVDPSYLSTAYVPDPTEKTVSSHSSIASTSKPTEGENANVQQTSSTARRTYPVSAGNAVLQCSSSEPVQPAGDPELENYYTAVRKPVNKPDIPLVTWVLVSLFLLSAIQKNAADSLIGEISQLFACAQLNGHRRNKPYSKRIMIFCLTLAGYSAKAYRYLRSSVNYCIPSPETLKNYRNRVDGSPGFSAAALNMVKLKVSEMSECSKKLFLSLSCDDISIRCIFYSIFQCWKHSIVFIEYNAYQ